MNKKILTILSIITLTVQLNVGIVYAANCELSEVKTRTRADGSSYVGIGESSGYVDEDGCPVSQEDYDKQIAEDKKSAQNRSKIIGGLVVVTIFAVVMYKKSRSKK